MGERARYSGPAPAEPRRARQTSIGNMQLIVFAGLPGTGKSSLAEAVGRKLAIPVFAKDWLEGVLVRCELQPATEAAPSLGFAGYELLTTLAERQLRLGQSVILDCVAGPQAIRAEWQALAAQYGAGWRVIECLCSDEAEHRSRLQRRVRGIPGWHELDWGDVQKVAAYYAPWQEPRLVLDAVQPWEDNLAAALRYLEQVL
jgi:predicted kinase